MFEGRRILITGGSSGLGKELAARLLERGASVVLLARNADKLRAVVDALQAPPERLTTVVCDVTDPVSVEMAFQGVREQGGPIHLLINSAGVLHVGRFDEIPLERYRQTMDINVFGTLSCVRAVLSHFAEHGDGRVVNIASVAGLMGVHDYAAYCASKHALVGLTETMRIELRPRGVRVHLVTPPEFAGPMVDKIAEARSAENKAMVFNIPPMTVEAVAADILRGVERDRFHIIPGSTTRTVVTMARLFPGLARMRSDQVVAAAKKSRDA